MQLVWSPKLEQMHKWILTDIFKAALTVMKCGSCCVFVEFVDDRGNVAKYIIFVYEQRQVVTFAWTCSEIIVRLVNALCGHCP